jgi:hypothetical protein
MFDCILNVSYQIGDGGHGEQSECGRTVRVEQTVADHGRCYNATGSEYIGDGHDSIGRSDGRSRIMSIRSF